MFYIFFSSFFCFFWLNFFFLAFNHSFSHKSFILLWLIVPWANFFLLILLLKIIPDNKMDSGEDERIWFFNYRSWHCDSWRSVILDHRVLIVSCFLYILNNKKMTNNDHCAYFFAKYYVTLLFVSSKSNKIFNLTLMMEIFVWSKLYSYL